MIKKSLNNYDKKRGIYLIKNNENGLCYIGESKDIKKRLIDHFSLMAPITSNLLYFDILGMEWSKFSIKVLFETSNEEIDLKQKEIEFISKLNTLYPNGYNIYGDTNSYFKKWIEIDNKFYERKQEINPENKNLFYENSKLTTSTIVPEYILNFISKGHFSEYCNLDFLIEYYKLNNIIELNTDSCSLQGINAKELINKNKDITDFAYRLEKVLYNNQTYTDKKSYVNLTEHFDYKDIFKIDFEKKLVKIYQSILKTNDPIVKGLYYEVFFNKISEFYQGKAKSRFLAIGTFVDKAKNNILIIKYPFIGYFKDRLHKHLVAKEYSKHTKVLAIDENSIMFFSKIDFDKILGVEEDINIIISGAINEKILPFRFTNLKQEVSFIISNL